MNEPELRKQLMEKAAGFEDSMAKLMSEAQLQDLAAYTRRQLAMLESEIARRKEQRSTEEGGFAE